VRSAYSTWLTRGQHATRSAYISVRALRGRTCSIFTCTNSGCKNNHQMCHVHQKAWLVLGSAASMPRCTFATLENTSFRQLNEQRVCRFRPRPHLQQCRNKIVECYLKSNDAFDKVERCFDIVAVFGNNVEQNIVFSTKSKQTEHAQFLSTLSKGRIKSQCMPRTRKDEILVRHCCHGNIVKAGFDFVEATFDFVAL